MINPATQADASPAHAPSKAPRRGRIHHAAGIVTAVLLASVAGQPWSANARGQSDQPSNPGQGEQPQPSEVVPVPVPTPPGSANTPVKPDDRSEAIRQREAAREAMKRQLDEQAKRAQDAARGTNPLNPAGVAPANAADPAAPGPGAPILGAPGAAGPQPPAPLAGDQPGVGALMDKDGEVSLNWTEPVDILAIADWVGRVLKINIIADEGITAGRVTFRAPMKVKVADLLKLLARLLEDHDLVFNKDPLGFYTIKAAGKVPIVFAGEGVDLATTRIIPTPMVRPSVMQQAVQQALGGQGGVPQGVRITPVDDIGVLIVTASPGVISTVEQIVSNINEKLADQKLHRFQLQHVSADFALNRILILNGKQAASGIPGQPVAIQPQAPAGAGGVSGSFTHLDSRLFIDPGNAIIFRGTDLEAEQVHRIIEMVDIVNTLVARRYATGSVTQDVATAGERVGLGPITQSSSSGNGAFGGFGGRTTSFTGLQGQAGQQSDLPGSGFTVDTEKGSIVYYGTETQHAIVKQLVETFIEQANEEKVEIRAYKLAYAKAKTVAEVLNNLLQNPQDRTANSAFLNRGTSRGTASPLVTPKEPEKPAAAAGGAAGEESATLTASSQDTVVVADEDRNQVLIKAAGRAQREFDRIIRKLDERQPQVSIEAKIIALRVDDQFKFSADLQIDAHAFQFLSGFGLTSPPTSGSGSGATTGAFNALRTIPAPTGTSGVTAALFNQDHALGVINALQTIGDARVVSSPRILVNDNQEATQESTREEPFSATSQVSGSPTITSQGGTATAGTKLKVKPTISKNGDVILEYEIELSSFDRSAGSSGANLQPPKQQEKYGSKVTVPSDSTIVVGGFTLETRQNTQNKVPFLGDIPLLGLLFKSLSEVKNRTTIFVFITPRVLNDPTGADLRILTEGPAKAADIEGIVPDFNPETITISPHLDVPPVDLGTGEPEPIDSDYSSRRRLPGPR